MKRVTGIGGVFIRAKNAEALGKWYRDHLGLDIQPWGGMTFLWADGDSPEKPGTTAWSVFPPDSKYFEPSTAPFMINYRVDDLAAVHAALKAEGCDVVGEIQDSEFGKFGWVMDCEGNKVELWEPPSEKLPG